MRKSSAKTTWMDIKCDGCWLNLRSGSARMEPTNPTRFPFLMVDALVPERIHIHAANTT